MHNWTALCEALSCVQGNTPIPQGAIAAFLPQGLCFCTYSLLTSGSSKWSSKVMGHHPDLGVPDLPDPDEDEEDGPAAAPYAGAGRGPARGRGRGRGRGSTAAAATGAPGIRCCWRCRNCCCGCSWNSMPCACSEAYKGDTREALAALGCSWRPLLVQHGVRGRARPVFGAMLLCRQSQKGRLWTYDQSSTMLSNAAAWGPSTA